MVFIRMKECNCVRKCIEGGGVGIGRRTGVEKGEGDSRRGG